MQRDSQSKIGCRFTQRRPFFYRCRAGFNLLELMAVAALLGMLAVVSVARVTSGVSSNVASSSESFRVLAALRQARTLAIATGDDHLVRFNQAGGQVTSYQLERDFGGTTQIVDGPYSFSEDLTITVVGGNPTFNFQGEATVAPVITFAGDDRTERITVVTATGWGVLEQF